MVILLTVGGFAGAASFTHVHDWTMDNSPTATGDWFGWANAVISELVPIASLLVMRRRRKAGQSVAYPACLLVAALAFSITAQLAVAKPGLSGGLVSVVPALAFAALAKLVLGKSPTPERSVAVPLTEASRPAETTSPAPAPVKEPQLEIFVRDRPGPPQAPVSTQDDQPKEVPVPKVWPTPPLPIQLIDAARRATEQHLAETGRAISRDELQKILRVSNATTGEVMRALELRDVPRQLAVAAVSPLTGKPLL